LLDGAIVRCPANQSIDTRSGRAEATGHCTFTTDDGSQVFSQWRCAGARGSCEGELSFTGGTGKLTGIVGGGRMVWRAGLADTAAKLTMGGAVRDAVGLLSWPSFGYELPGR
jgi:hypothetical protein